MATKKASNWKKAAIVLGVIGLGFGAFKVTQFFTERTRANRVKINFVR